MKTVRLKSSMIVKLLIGSCIVYSILLGVGLINAQYSY